MKLTILTFVTSTLFGALIAQFMSNPFIFFMGWIVTALIMGSFDIYTQIKNKNKES